MVTQAWGQSPEKGGAGRGVGWGDARAAGLGRGATGWKYRVRNGRLGKFFFKYERYLNTFKLFGKKLTNRK